MPTDEKKRALAQRATAAIQALGLEMPPGMRATWPDDARPCRRYGSPGETAGWVSDYSGDERYASDVHALPDLDDDAAKGAMLGLVRKAWDDPRAYVAPSTCPDRSTSWTCWVLTTTHGPWPFVERTEGEALVAALEAAARQVRIMETMGTSPGRRG